MMRSSRCRPSQRRSNCLVCWLGLQRDIHLVYTWSEPSLHLVCTFVHTLVFSWLTYINRAWHVNRTLCIQFAKCSCLSWIMCVSMQFIKLYLNALEIDSEIGNVQVQCTNWEQKRACYASDSQKSTCNCMRNSWIKFTNWNWWFNG